MLGGMVLVMAVGLFGLTTATLDVYKLTNSTSGTFSDHTTWPSTEARFGGALGNGGLAGLVTIADPLYACSPIANVTAAESGRTRIVLIKRGNNCTFGDKVYHAQLAGYVGAIIFNDDDSGQLTIMDYTGDLRITIPSIFVPQSAGSTLLSWVQETGNETVVAEMWPDVYVVRSFLFTFVTIVAGISIIFTLFLFYRRHTIISRHRPKARMTRTQALKLPKRSFKADDADETCCICLDNYARGDTITTLPCKHFFHQACIRPWLQEQQRVCPICKRDPVTTVAESERTPLLSLDSTPVEDPDVESGPAPSHMDAASSINHKEGDTAILSPTLSSSSLASLSSTTSSL